MPRYTGHIVRQLVCDKVFNKNKPMKKDEKLWHMLSELSVEQSENFVSHNFEGVKGIVIER